MEGGGGAGAGSRATPASWDLGPQWAPPTSAYPHHRFMPPPAGLQELTSLELGKRPCCPPDGTGGGGRRKEKAAAATAAVPRCQVQGCHLALAGAKEYHRRHKVCEAHSKAPRVVVHGAEQRFCQQCSRYVRAPSSSFGLHCTCRASRAIVRLAGATRCPSSTTPSGAAAGASQATTSGGGRATPARPWPGAQSRTHTVNHHAMHYSSPVLSMVFKYSNVCSRCDDEQLAGRVSEQYNRPNLVKCSRLPA
jgi:hypothetical protein